MSIEDMENEGGLGHPDIDGNGDFATPTDEELTEMAEETQPMPTYVAVVGVYGSGKSDLAAAISGYYGMEMIDGYADALAGDMDIALGPFASYIPNLMVAMEREKAEHKNRREMDINGVTCGTLIETLAYAALQVEYHNLQITTPQQQAIIARETLASQVISLMIQDVMRYHKYFYLPLPIEIEIPGQDPKYDNFQRSLDNATRQIIGTLGVPVTELTGTLEQKMDAVKEELGEALPL